MATHTPQGGQDTSPAPAAAALNGAKEKPSEALVAARCGRSPSPQARAQTPLGAGGHVLVKSDKGESGERQGRIIAVSESGESCSVVFADGETDEAVPTALVERERQVWELRPQLQGRFASSKTLEEKLGIDFLRPRTARQQLRIDVYAARGLSRFFNARTIETLAKVIKSQTRLR